MRRVLLLATGGTIASAADHEGGPVTARISGNDLLQGLTLAPDIEVTVKNPLSRGSNALTLEDLLALAREIEAETETYDGFVITHGTDTMEESAWLLELLLAPQKPVVLTGAQRHAEEPGTDGPRNLADALQAAASPDLADAGTVILFEGDIHAARYVRKYHSSRVDTFRSGAFGKLGSVDQQKLRLSYSPRRLAGLGTRAAPAKVWLISAAMGQGPELLDHALHSDCAGVVLQGFGRGNFPYGWCAAAERLIKAGKPVVISSRCSEGELAPIYGNDGGGATMAALGAWFAGDLDPWKARILLAFLLGQDPQSAKARFALYAG